MERGRERGSATQARMNPNCGIYVRICQGKEIITRFTSNISSNGVAYTDSNGREMQVSAEPRLHCHYTSTYAYLYVRRLVPCNIHLHV